MYVLGALKSSLLAKGLHRVYKIPITIGLLGVCCVTNKEQYSQNYYYNYYITMDLAFYITCMHLHT